jgi:hypothetical protein
MRNFGRNEHWWEEERKQKKTGLHVSTEIMTIPQNSS